MPQPVLDDVSVESPNDTTAVAVFSGDHDLASRDDVRAFLVDLVQRYELVVADFSTALFIDSSMLNALLDVREAAEARGSTLRLQLSTAAIVRRAFEISGVSDVIECTSTRDEALGVRP